MVKPISLWDVQCVNPPVVSFEHLILFADDFSLNFCSVRLRFCCALRPVCCRVPYFYSFVSLFFPDFLHCCFHLFRLVVLINAPLHRSILQFKLNCLHYWWWFVHRLVRFLLFSLMWFLNYLFLFNLVIHCVCCYPLLCFCFPILYLCHICCYPIFHSHIKQVCCVLIFPQSLL